MSPNKWTLLQAFLGQETQEVKSTSPHHSRLSLGLWVSPWHLSPAAVAIALRTVARLRLPKLSICLNVNVQQQRAPLGASFIPYPRVQVQRGAW